MVFEAMLRVRAETIQAKPLFTMELTGGPHDRGYQAGYACKSLIARMIEVQFVEEFAGRLTMDQMLKRARKYEPFIEAYSPEIAEELHGIAEGSGRLYDEIVMVNALEERKAFEPPHCTTFAATGAATQGGVTYTGQTWDGIEKEWWDGTFGLLFRVRDRNGPDLLDYTNPGILASAGLNAKGVAVNWNTVPQPELTEGVPSYLVIAEMLRQKTLGDALDAVRRANRAGYFSCVVTDGTEVYEVEASPGNVDISYGGEYVGHANHFVSKTFPSRLDAEVSSSSLIRHNRMNRLLKESCGEIELQTCMGFLRDHVNYPYSICSHPGDEPDPRQRGLTLDAWISVPSKQEFWIAHGLPCENEFVRFSL